MRIIQRIGEGIVVGIVAAMMFNVIAEMKNARVQLTQARDTINIQLNVNQSLLDKLQALQSRLNTIETTTRSSTPDTEPTERHNTSFSHNEDRSEGFVLREYTEATDLLNIQDDIDRQRALNTE